MLSCSLNYRGIHMLTHTEFPPVPPLYPPGACVVCVYACTGLTASSHMAPTLQNKHYRLTRVCMRIHKHIF